MSTLKKFAEELRVKREALGISLIDIYEKTRIDKKYLEEMEKGNFGIMPDVYMRAFIRKYAEAVDLKPDDVIKKYEAACEGKTIDDVKDSDEEKAAGQKDESGASTVYESSNPEYDETIEKKIKPLIIIGFVVALIFIGVFYFAFIDSNNEEIVVEKKVEDILSERNTQTESTRFEIKQKKPEEKIITAKSDSLSLKINAIDTSWFRIEIDKTKKDEFILNPNRTKILNAENQIKLLIGNAGGIEFILNGKKLNFTGKKGEIRNVTIDSDGIHYSKKKNTLENE